MVFICNLENKVYTLSNSTLNQGSNRASEIVLLAPYSGASVVSIAIVTPDGTIHEPLVMNRTEIPQDLPEVSKLWSAWQVDVPSSLTEQSGTLTMRFYITLPDSPIIATSDVSKPVIRGQSFVDPNVPVEWDWNSFTQLSATLIQHAMNAERDADRAEDVVETVEKAASNASKSAEDASGYASTALAIKAEIVAIKDNLEADLTEYVNGLFAGIAIAEGRSY